MKTFLDPTSERSPGNRARAPRPASLQGKLVGLLDISKPRGSVLLDRLEERLTALGAKVERFSKPTFSKPAPLDLRQELASKCAVVVEALAD